MTNILWVGIGGFIGSVLRYLVGGYIQQYSRSLPLGTLAVNILGCFVIGFLIHASESTGVFSETSRAFIFIGVLGGFTTFSSFGNETLNLARDSQMLHAFTNIVANVILGLSAVWLGRIVATWIWR